MLLIYTHKVTTRFSYIMRHIFGDMLGLEVGFSTLVEDFIKHSGPKITYTKQPLQNEFFVRSHELLFEQGVGQQSIGMGEWMGTPCFFPTNERSNLPYDIFAASFYLISRYEECMPHIKDSLKRYSPKESLAYQHGFLHLPVVDLWVASLAQVLKERFPDLKYVRKKYRLMPLIDVTTSHSYAYKGLVRSVGGLAADMLHLQLRAVFQRVSIWFRPKKDPYDNFSFLVALHKKYGVKPLFFFLFAEYSNFDKNVATTKMPFRHLIKSMADYATVGLVTSHASFSKSALLVKEKKELEAVVNRSVDVVRRRHNRIDVPDGYRNLVDAGFTDDYTMGYTNELGFRAGTCTPFHFYDIGLESKRPIKVHPFSIHDYALTAFPTLDAIRDRVRSLQRQVAEVHGEFVVIFSNELIGGERSEEWKRLYTELLQENHV